jgi:MFS family permease
MIALALRLSPGALIAVWFARGIAIGVLSAVWDTTLQRHIAYESMARVSSWDWMTSGGLWPIGLVIAGPIAQVLGVTETLWLSAGCGVAFSLWVLFVKDVWRLRGPQGTDRSPKSALP